MRFTFIHAADLHIDSPLDGLGLKDKAVAARFAEAGRRAVKTLVAETIASQAAFLIIAGDVFDGDWKDVTTGLFFVSALGALHRAGIPTILVKGNHDADSVMSGGLSYPESVRTFPSNKADSIALETHRVMLHGRSFSSRSVPDNFVQSYPARREGWLNIGVLHTALDGTRGHEGYAPCSIETLRRFGYDYWALGHIHAAEVVSRDPWIVYPGNLQGRSVRETGAKGAARVTVADGRIVDVMPLALDGARWAHEMVDASGCDNEAAVLDRIATTLANLHSRSDGRALAVRITLTGATPLHDALIAHRESMQDEARALGFGIAEDCWVEQIKVATSLPVQMIVALSQADSLDVAQLLAAAATDPAFASELTILIASIVEKLPRDLRDQFDSEPERLTRLASDARAFLAGGLGS